MPAKILLFDEVDDYPDDAGGQGEPIRIATARQDTFARRKRLKTSSPKRPKGHSTIERAFESGTRCEFFVPCPHCEHMQTLRWAQLQWVNDPVADPDSAAYACEDCGGLIEEHWKGSLLERGEWRAQVPAAPIHSYRLNSLYSPIGWLTWRTLVREFLDAKTQSDQGNPQALRTFVNTRLAETWEEQAERIAVSELQTMAKDFRLGTVPAEGLVLVAFVDVQDDRFELGVWALGAQGDMWTVDHRVIPANPGLEEDWRKVDASLQESYPHAHGGKLRIEAAAIDTGGHYTHDVYRFVRRMPSSRKIAATKGADRPGMPILGKASTVDVNWRGGVAKRGVKLWAVGVNAAKDLLFTRLRAGRVHMSRDLPPEWFEQLAAEHRVRQRTARGERSVWVKRTAGARNEALDIAVGALWCIERLGASRWPKAYWEMLRQRVAPDLFAVETPSSGANAHPASRVQTYAIARKRVGGAPFATRWKR
jgi:phage terminase large subunit GpA-like protein